MTADVAELLKRRAKKPKGPFVFPAKSDPERPIGSVRKAHDSAVEKAGIKEHFRLYDLRHTFATRAVAAGVDLQPFPQSRTHQHSDDNAVRPSCGGTETLCSREARNFRLRMVEAMEKVGRPLQFPLQCNERDEKAHNR